MLYFHIFILSILFASSTLADVVVNTTVGQIRGLELTTQNGTKFYAFLGIPFAKPPTGDLRFQAPQPPENWTGIFNATSDSNICYSASVDSPLENEDCLYLNVFVPVLNQEAYPVMFLIYGGGFRNGNARYGTGGPEWFLEQGIIVVTSNYRIGPFGFLSTGDTIIPGNAGLKDQLLALKWTYNNIGSFGGDNLKLTISGQSAGGASVGFHLLSKKSTGLFRAALAESGSPICSWAYRSNPKANTVLLAQALNSSISSTETSNVLKHYLQSVEAKEIDVASAKMQYNFLPVIEAEHDDAFITQDFYEILASGDVNKVPLLIGYNSEEEIAEAGDIKSLATSAAMCDSNYRSLIPSSMNAKSQDGNTIGDDIKYMYVGNKTFEEELGLLIRFESDTTFIRPVIKHAKIYAKFQNVYLYEFSYKGKMGNINITIEGADLVGHGEETKYLFVSRSKTYDNTIDENFPVSDLVTKKRLITMWTNFVKYMNPTPKLDDVLQNVTWPILDPTTFEYLDIGENLTVKQNPKGNFYAGWEPIFEKYGQRPFVTY